ncbi:Rho termination factor N-terminal domain-containing protein [Madurella fahalii]|uniref:Rho termination factor N-terminal domain-containing protein n=1 Tax=Madurella fahalii TaxID=1157608 RepID=A0ABQ0GBC3_9PEZI
MSGGNSWLARQRKSDLVELAQTIGLKDYEGLRKSDLELVLDEYLSEHATQYQSNPKFNDYFKSRARAGGSPIKKEIAPPPEMKPSRRRSTKPTEEIVAAEEEEEEEEDEEEEDDEQEGQQPASSTATALVRTPGRALTLAASRVQMLPATPADVARAVDRSTVAVRERVASLYHESGITEATQTTREWLSTVQSVLASIALFELYRLRQEILPDRYAFTIPAIAFLGTDDYPVNLPDMFALVTAGFWGPALTWMLTSLVIPGVFGYFFNLSAAHNSGGGAARGRGRPAAKHGHQQEYAVDPLTFSLVKAVATYVVYAQGVTFGGLISPDTVARINGALYSGWKGVLVGTAVAGVTAVYDAVLKK